jgi:hypothetical protein
LPNVKVVVLTVNVGMAAPSCSTNDCELFPVDAVSVTGCDVFTGVPVAVNPALVEPAAIATADGTETAVLLLARFTVNPPDGAAPLIVTVQASVPDPVSEFVVQLRPDRLGRIEIVPVPLNPTVSVPLADALLTRVIAPVTVPAEVGSNRTLSATD